MTTKILRPIFLAAFAASLTFTNSLRAAIPPAENLLPADTLFFLTIPDCAALRTAAHQSPQWLFWSDPAMKPFHDKFAAKFAETLVAPLEQNLGMKISDFADLPQGQFTLAVTQNGWTGGGDPLPGVVLLLDTGDKSDLLKTNLDTLKKKWTDDGKPIRTEDVRGISFSVVTISTNNVPMLSGLLPRRQPVRELGQETKPETPTELVVGQFESLLIVGSSVKAVEPIAAHLSASLLPSLNDDAVFAADKISQFRDAPLYYGWLNAKTLFYVLAHMPQTQNPRAPRPMAVPQLDKILDATGLTGVKSASFAYRETRDGSQVGFFIAAPEADRKGLLKIFAAAQKTAVPQPFVPADAVKFWRWRLDGQDGWAALEKMLGEISPMATASLDSAINMANANARKNDPDFDLRKNLIDNLGDDFISYQKASAGTSLADLNNAPSLYLIGVEKGGPAATAIKDLLSLSMPRRQKAPEPRDFQGHKIYTMPLPGQRGGGTAAAAPVRSLYITSSSGYVALSTDVSTLEEYLRSGEKPPQPLSGMPGLIDAAQYVGGTGGGLFGYQNQREVLRSLFKMLKNQSSTGSAGGMNPMAALPKEVRDWLDFSLLPDYDQVAKYFYFSVYAGSTTADGLALKAFAPRPPQMNGEQPVAQPVNAALNQPAKSAEPHQQAPEAHYLIWGVAGLAILAMAVVIISLMMARRNKHGGDDSTGN
jgi:hypothetical protein